MHTILDEQLVITVEQLKAANADSIRKGLNRTLDLPADFPDLAFPILDVWEDNNNCRMLILFWESVESAYAGDEPKQMILDVTPDWIAALKFSSREILKTVPSRRVQRRNDQ